MKTYVLTCYSCYGKTLYTNEDIYRDYGYGGIVAFVECSKCKKANDVSDRDYNYDSVKTKDAIMTCSSCDNKTYYGIENIEEEGMVKCPNCGSFNQIDL